MVRRLRVRRCAKLITPLEADNEGLREPQLLRWHVRV
jgi:hypothetical protein